MSTKIYDAYRIEGGISDVFKIKALLERAYERDIIQYLPKLMNAVVTKDDITHEFDKCLIGQPLGELSQFVIAQILEKHCNENIKCSNVYDVSAQLVLYLHKDNTYMQLYYRPMHKKMDKCVQGLLKRGIITDFHYQNQTDPPKQVSESEWQGRRRVWDNIFNARYITPAQAGFVHSFHSRISSIVFKWNDISRTIPP